MDKQSEETETKGVGKNSLVEVFQYPTGNGSGLDVFDSRGYTALMRVCGKGDIKSAKYLVEQKADPNKANRTGRTALSYSFEMGQLEIIKYLVEEAKVKMVKISDVQCLAFLGFNAPLANYVEIFEYLEGKGLDIEPNFKYQGTGSTVFMSAVAFGNKAFIKKLKERYGAKTDIVDINGHTVLSYAVEQRSFEIVQYLIEEAGMDANTVSGFDCSILSYAVTIKSQKVEIIECLVKNRADLENKDKRRRTPLMKAVMHYNFKIVEYLVKAGADTNIVDDEGDTLLMSAVGDISIEMVRFLVEEAGVNTEVKNKLGDTALSKFIYEAHNFWDSLSSANDPIKIVEYLVDTGVSVDKNFFLARDEDEDGVASLSLCSTKESRKRIENLRENVIDRFIESVQSEVAYAFFSRPSSPFFGLDNKKGTFGYHTIQTMTYYMIPTLNELQNASDDEWSMFLLQINSYQKRKKNGFIFSPKADKQK